MTKRRLWIAAALWLCLRESQSSLSCTSPSEQSRSPAGSKPGLPPGPNTCSWSRPADAAFQRVPRTYNRASSKARVFGVDCAACHGMDGRRATDAGRWIYPRAADLTSKDAKLFRPGIVLDHQEWDAMERHAGFCKS